MKAIVIIVGTLVLLCLGAPAWADFIENFDSYAAGSQMHGQGGWAGWGGDANAGALVSGQFSLSNPNSVAITGASDLTHSWTNMTSGTWEVRAMQYVPTGATGETYFILMNKYITGFEWSGELKFDLVAGKAVDDFAPDPKVTLSIVRDKWIEIKQVVDLEANTVQVYYNGGLLGSHRWYDATNPNQQKAIEAIDLFANNAAPVYYDDISFTLVPEPVTMTLMLAGLAGMVLRRKKV